MRGRNVLSQAKCLTTEDVTTGVISAISTAITRLEGMEEGYKVAERVCRVNIGTTHFVNAVVQKKGLARVSVVRLCGSSTTALPPFVNFPPDLAQVVRSSVHLLRGGFEFNGSEIEPVDEQEIRECFSALREAGSANVVVCGVFAPVCSDQERRVLEVAREVYPDASYTLSHWVGHLGLLERENAAILNEALKPLSAVTIDAFQSALSALQLACPLYLTQNDGTLISSANTRDFPILTFSSGPTNSMRGGMWLSGVTDGVVVDIGGTTTDVGVLKNGFPREASTLREVGGVPINFRLPDVPSIGLGGGSVVRTVEEPGQPLKVTVGPDSVGNALFKRGVAFGGDVLTTTDVAMAAGVSELLPHATHPSLSPALVYSAMRELHRMLEALIDKVKTDREDVPVILVGGGSMLVDSSLNLKGVSRLIRPPHYSVANAVGAALGQFSGSVDHIVTMDEDNPEESRRRHLDRSRDLAIQSAVKAGAVPSSVRVVEVREVPVPYVGPSGKACRMSVKAVGDLQSGSTEPAHHHHQQQQLPPTPDVEVGSTPSQPPAVGDCPCWPSPSEHVQRLDRQAGLPEPDVDRPAGVWTLTVQDVECLAVGAGILGCGGGGSPSVGKLLATKAIQEGKAIRVQNPYRVPVGGVGWVVPVAFMGAPTVLVEKIVSGRETGTALLALRQLLASGLYRPGGGGGRRSGGGVTVSEMEGHPEVWTAEGYQDVRLDSSVPPECSVQYLVPSEIGGLNSIEPLLTGAELGLPVLDADGMGRAFPELQMYLPFIEGGSPYPTCIADNKGRVVVVSHCPSARALEGVLRTETVRMGLTSGLVLGCLRVPEVMDKCILLSLSSAWALGRAVLRANRARQPPYSAIVESRNGRLLINGKIIDARRSTEEGFSAGRLVVEGEAQAGGKYLIVDFQNENLTALHSPRPTLDSSSTPQPGDVVTPDLIAIIDADTGYPVTTEEVQYGMRVAVVAMAADPKLKTERALRVVGPRAFHYNFDYLDFSLQASS